MLTSSSREADAMRLLVIIPAYNEEGSIERVVDNLIQNHSQYDLSLIHI